MKEKLVYTLAVALLAGTAQLAPVTAAPLSRSQRGDGVNQTGKVESAKKQKCPKAKGQERGKKEGQRLSPTSLDAATDRILVSPPDHRISEFNIAQNPCDPNHLVVGAMDFDPPSGGVACVAYVSRDGGRTWTEGETIPGLDTPGRRADPWAAIGRDGTAHLACLDPPALMHARSPDGGDTWEPAEDIPAAAPGNYRDKEAMLVTDTGRLIVCVNDFPDPDDDLWVYQSDDGGRTWLPPMNLEADRGEDGRGHCPDIAQGPKGEIYAGHMTVRSTPNGFINDYGTVASYNDGRTWKRARVADSDYFGGSTAHLFFGAPPTEPSPSVSSLTVSPTTGTVFTSMGHYNSDTGLWEPRLHKSTDRGRAYAEVKLPTIESACTPCHVARPFVTVDAAGRLAVEVLVASLDGGLNREVWLLVSPDEGKTWLEPFRVAATDRAVSWANPLTWVPHSPYLVEHPDDPNGGITDLSSKDPRSADRHLRWGGDYWDLTGVPDGFLAMWVDHYNGYPQIWARIVKVR